MQNQAPAAAATQALNLGEAPTAVALHEALVTLSLIEGFGSKKPIRFVYASSGGV
jgi:hypothetical protein